MRLVVVTAAWLCCQCSTSRLRPGPSSTQEGGSTDLQKDSGDQGSVELCRLDDLLVQLDRNTNVRTLTFGSSSAERLLQTQVHCEGSVAPSCMEGHNSNGGCALQSVKCPCTFDMAELPALDGEYKYISKRVLSGKIASLDTDGISKTDGDLAGRVAGASARLVLVGLGGGMLPQYLIENSPALSVDAIELRADVVEVGRAFFGIASAEASGRLRIIQGDALLVLGKTAPSSYGAAIVDCFGDSRLPEHCRSREFVEALYWAVLPGGEVLQNVVTGRPDNPKLDQQLKQDRDELLSSYKAVFGSEVELAMKNSEHNAVIRAKRN